MRFELHGDPEHPFSEAVGFVMDVSPKSDGAECVRLVDRRGRQIEVDVADIVAIKSF